MGRWIKRLALALLCLLPLAAAAMYYVLDRSNAPPRQLAPYLERRADGHNPFLVAATHQLGALLQEQDRGESDVRRMADLHIGAQAEAALAPAGARRVPIGSPEQLRQALANAMPGDALTLLPGIYRMGGAAYLDVGRPGTAERPITVRAERPGTVVLEMNMVEGFLVRAPYWSFSNLTIRGVCGSHGSCEHAFHVVGDGHHFVARNNTVQDFNAHFKINGHQGQYPDYGLIAGNTLDNNSPRNTDNPVTPIDLVAASHWHIQNNLIADFIKAGGDQISYGAFAKGAGSANAFEGNAVLCEQKLRRLPGQRVGLSLGGGGTSRDACRDSRCVTEQNGGVIRANLVAFCSDEGIYINSAAASEVHHNTLLDTAGVMARFPASAVAMEGNIVDGRIAAANGALLRAGDNRVNGVARLYLGSHPQRELYRSVGSLDLAWNGAAPRRAMEAAGMPDLCGATRPRQPAYGAFEDFDACRVR